MYQVPLKRSVCLVRGWDTTKIHVNGHASASSHTGQARMKYDSGWEVHRVMLVGATPFKYVFVGVILCSS